MPSQVSSVRSQPTLAEQAARCLYVLSGIAIWHAFAVQHGVLGPNHMMLLLPVLRGPGPQPVATMSEYACYKSRACLLEK
jgi:hypothetical protein